MLRDRIVRVLQTRLEKNSIDEVASALDCTTASVYYYLSRQRIPSPDRLDKLYEISPQNSLTKSLTLDLLRAFPPNGNGDKPAP